MADRQHLGGITNTTLHFESDGTLHVEDKLDAAPILDFAHAARNHRFSADACDGMLRHEAEIPFTVFMEECRKRGLTMQCLGTEIGDKIIDAILSDPQYAHFKTAPTQRDARIRMKGLR